MSLSMILSALGSAAAGANMLGTLSPLIAGAIGSGLGAAIEQDDVGAGIMAGLTSGIMGKIGGGLVNPEPAGFSETAAQISAAAGGNPTAPTAEPSWFQKFFGGSDLGGIADIPTGLTPGPAMVGKTATAPVPYTDMAKQGWTDGINTGAGWGTLAGAFVSQKPKGMELEERRPIPQAQPHQREQYPVYAGGYNPLGAGYVPEKTYYDPNQIGYRGGDPKFMAEGGPVGPNFELSGMDPVGVSGGGLGGIASDAMTPKVNEKDVIKLATLAVQGQLDEKQSAVVLSMLLQLVGEEKFLRFVEDVENGAADGERGYVEGLIEGPGNGTDDLVPATNVDNGQDILLSDNEYIVKADAVENIGVDKLDRMVADATDEEAFPDMEMAI